MDIDRSTPHREEPIIGDEGTDLTDDSTDDGAEGIFAADDTGMLSGERIITVAETNSASPDAGNV